MHHDPSPPRPIRATRALTHPLWWVALALLVANDHLFKGAGVLPGALTGKLSDFAGLLVAPVVLAALLGVRERRGWLGAHLAVGLGFAAINLSPAVARAVEAATLPTPFPWWITVDPTDLVALPMLLVSAAVFGAWCRRPVALRPAAARMGLALGSVACVATSPPPEEVPPEPWPEQQPTSTDWGHIGVVNSGADTVTVRTRALRRDVVVDCDAVARDPALHLAPDLFDGPLVWSMEPGALISDRDFDPQGSERACRVALMATARGARLLFALHDVHREGDLTYVSGAGLPDDPSLVGLDGETLTHLADHPVVFTAPRGEPVEATCAVPEPGAGLAWTFPPVEQGVLVGHGVGPDGCHALDIEFVGDDGGPETGRWYVCAPGAPLDLPEGAELSLSAESDQSGTRVRIEAGDRTMQLVRTRRTDGFAALSVAEPTNDDPCRTAWRDSCDGVMAPLVVRDAEGPLPLGEPVRTAPDTVTTVIRAEQARVSDSACDPWAAVGPRIELVIETRDADAQEDAR